MPQDRRLTLKEAAYFPPFGYENIPDENISDPTPLKMENAPENKILDTPSWLWIASLLRLLSTFLSIQYLWINPPEI